jgi:glycosyltransferase involved in cell wall biosynthesis
MRILFLSSSGQLGGAERLLLDLAGALRRLHPDWALHLAAIEPGPLVNEANTLGVGAEVIPLPPQLAGLGEAGLSIGTLVRRAAGTAGPTRRYIARVRAHVARVGPTIVHSHGLKTHLVSALALGARLPLIWHLHDYVGARQTTSKLLALAARRAALAIANSASVARDAERVFAGRLPVVTVLNGVDVERLSAQGPALDLDRLAGLPPAPDGTVRVGMMATFARWKGQLAFLEAMARLPADARVRGYVIGGPVYQTSGSQFTVAELTDRAAALGLAERVGFTGFQPDRAAALRALDVVVHASTAPEPFGLVIAEAMSAGRAVITSGLGGAAELVRPGVDALMWDAGDPATLARAIGALAGDADERRRIGREAQRAAISRFSTRRMAAEMSAAYATALGVVPQTA